MKNFKIKYFIYMLIALIALSSCTNYDNYDGLILTDNETGRVYLLKHHIGDTYMIDEKVIKIIGRDTTEVFE